MQRNKSSSHRRSWVILPTSSGFIPKIRRLEQHKQLENNSPAQNRGKIVQTEREPIIVSVICFLSKKYISKSRGSLKQSPHTSYASARLRGISMCLAPCAHMHLLCLRMIGGGMWKTEMIFSRKRYKKHGNFVSVSTCGQSKFSPR